MSVRVLVVLVLSSLLSARRSDACATVDHDPNQLATRVAGEEAIIVFDATTNTEHFIRSAEFRTAGADVGFIVPTPTPPTFGEVDQAVFAELAHSYEAARAEKVELELSSLLLLTLSRSGGPGVYELSSSRVAGMDVTVLGATDANALEGWLTKHGFASRPALKAWLDAYLQRGFVFSAFRYPAAEQRVTTRAVRISFTTPTPVYPYLEPADALPRANELRVWLVTPERRAWVDGIAAPLPPREFASTTKFSVPASIAALAPASKWVSLFIDARRTRPAADVRFEPAADQLEVPPAPKVRTIEIPLEGLLLAGVVVVLVLALRRRSAPT
ncbi:MAG: DUF2330 domain-containing protein [Myxococcaceae bacterium]